MELQFLYFLEIIIYSCIFALSCHQFLTSGLRQQVDLKILKKGLSEINRRFSWKIYF